MASNPPAQCCTVGVKHEGTPTGKLEMTGEFESYVARPSADKKHDGVAILFLTDVLGHKLDNAQLLADQWAANGYYTVVPDILFDDPIPMNRPESFNMQNWLAGKAPDGKHPHGSEATRPVAEKMTAWLRDQGYKRIGALGFCFGAKYAIQLLAGQIEAAYVAHPSFVEEEELENIKGPLSIAAAETDGIFPPEKRHKSEEILKALSPKQPWQINVYSGVQHGFSVRGDVSKPEAKFAKEQAFYQGVQWMDQWLLK